MLSKYCRRKEGWREEGAWGNHAYLSSASSLKADRDAGSCRCIGRKIGADIESYYIMFIGIFLLSQEVSEVNIYKSG